MKATTVAALLFALAYLQSAYANPTTELKKASFRLTEAYSKATQEYYVNNGEELTILASKEAVKAQLKDPNSAQFKNVRLVAYLKGYVICGAVNARNSFGGYTGFTPFIACPAHALILNTSSTTESATDPANAGLYAACGK